MPPAPEPEPEPEPGCTPTFDGTNAPRGEVEAALEAAGAIEFWVGVQRPSNLEGPLPTITVPPDLMKAVAWQESGWQSAIVACDGGRGTMQLMPGTVEQVHQRFEIYEHDPGTLGGNTKLGAAYLEWLIMFFGTGYFGQNYDLSVTANVPLGPNGEQMALIDLVIAAYNVGPYELFYDSSHLTFAIPNWDYVNAVEAHMVNKPWLNA